MGSPIKVGLFCAGAASIVFVATGAMVSSVSVVLSAVETAKGGILIKHGVLTATSVGFAALWVCGGVAVIGLCAALADILINWNLKE